MSNAKISEQEKAQLELEDKAFRELIQIIAIAYQVQDIEYVNNMISNWKNKYKKTLDNATPNFKKKIEQLLNESYSRVVEYILSQIKFKEEKMIKNQRKALQELYNLIRDNYDLETLKNKIKKWESKYPYNSFLKMYQKRIDSMKREKNLEKYAFKQEEAFRDLYYNVANRSGTIEELHSYLKTWEDKYSINNKFTIDQFIKHQSEVKRYVSDDFLISIARKDEHILDETPPQVTDSSLSVQDSAYKSLKSIIKGKNNLYEVFKWVYTYHSIKFNDRYKGLILIAIDRDYSPKYLQQISIPDINITKPTLPFEQYSNIDEIVRYAIISYFNLLLPPNMAISNNYFNKHIREIYYKFEELKHSNISNTSIKEIIPFVTEIPLVNKSEPVTKQASIEEPSETKEDDLSAEKDIVSEVLDTQSKQLTEPTQATVEEPSETKEVNLSAEKVIVPEVLDTQSEQETETIQATVEKPSETKEDNLSEEVIVPQIFDEKPRQEFNSKETIVMGLESNEYSDFYASTHTKPENKINSRTSTNDLTDESIDYTTAVVLLPQFFESINNYRTQARLIDRISTKYSNSKSINYTSTKTRTEE